ncbi:hypothetical protein NE237_024030 [Protea cynaroides]|uniref:Glutamate receptor n=1 Tax=Protea cynaroides TaxID=273540 RepID=A0A9Q0HF36_9MAGN|nr:hypothetical protein NE237_024030 [Protea cynaroides]
MSRLRLLLVWVFHFEVFSNGLPRPAVVNIGSIFTFSSTNGKVAKIAMQVLTPVFLVETTYSFLCMTPTSVGFWASLEMTAIADMVSYNSWRNVIAVFTDDDNGRNGISALGDKLAEKRCKISYKAALPPDTQTTRSDVQHALIKDTLSKLLDLGPRVIVVHSDKISGQLVFDVADSLGMMGSAYVWIATTWLSSTLDSGALGTGFSEKIQGVLTLRPHTPDSEKKKAFSSRWSQLSGGSVGLTNVVLKGALQLNEMSIFDGGRQLLDNMLHTNMTGLTGPIPFNPDRSIIHPAYDVINVMETGFRQIGYWSNNSRLTVVPPETFYMKPLDPINQQLYNPVWPDVFTAALKLLPYDVPYKFIPFGDGIRNPNYSDILNLVASDKLDAGVGDISISTNRTKFLDFTQPYNEAGLVIMVSLKKLNSNAWVFLRPFTPMMWAATAGFSLLFGAVVWILEHRINDEFRGPPKQQIVTILWFSFSTLFFAHREKIVSSLSRLVLIIWLFAILIISSSYTASLTSILTVQQLSSPIKGVESLITSTEAIGFREGSFAKNYLTAELNIPQSRLIALGSPEEYAAALERGTVAAIVDEKTYIDVFLPSHCKFSVVGQEFAKKGWGFAFPRDSPLAIDLSTAILELSENGDLQRIHDKWLIGPTCSSQPDTQSDQLQLRSFSGLFIICGIACFVAVLIYFVSMIQQFSKQFSEESHASGFGSLRSACLRRFLLYLNEKEEESKSKSKRKQMEQSSNVYREQDEQRKGFKRLEIDNYSWELNSWPAIFQIPTLTLLDGHQLS